MTRREMKAHSSGLHKEGITSRETAASGWSRACCSYEWIKLWEILKSRENLLRNSIFSGRGWEAGFLDTQNLSDYSGQNGSAPPRDKDKTISQAFPCHYQVMPFKLQKDSLEEFAVLKESISDSTRYSNGQPQPAAGI